MPDTTTGVDDAETASLRFAEALRLDADTAATLIDADFRAIARNGAETHGREALSGLEPIGPATAVAHYGDVTLLSSREPVEGGERVGIELWVRRTDGWRLLVRHLNVIAASDAPSGRPAHLPRPSEAPAASCPNPLDFVPYDPKSEAERDIIRSFQTLESYVVRNEAELWVQHMADEFVVYRTGQHPTTRDERAGHLREQKAINAEIHVAAVEAMTLWVFGDAAVMRADHVMPGNRRPPYRATRVWAKRDGRWQMALSQQTTRAGEA